MQINDSTSKENIVDRLISLFWQYPQAGGYRRSWAVKESAVLLGHLESAQEKPGLGIAIFSTQLAKEFFGKAAENRIDNCINWALENTQVDPPYLVQVESRNPITYELEIKPDLRHSISLGIILARMSKHLIHVEHYLDVVLGAQSSEGGWPIGSGTTTSEIFSTLYAIEFLSLCTKIKKNNTTKKINSERAMIRGFNWLTKKAHSKHYLWRTSLFEDYPWNSIFTSSWILRRLSPLKEIDSILKNKVFVPAINSMVRLMRQKSPWEKTEQLQKFRVEARAASAISTVLRSLTLDSFLEETLGLFLNDWKKRSTKILNNISEDNLDLATTLFLIDSFLDPNDIQDWVAKNVRNDHF